MPEAARKKPVSVDAESRWDYRDDGSILDDEAVLPHLDAELEPALDGDDDPLKGILNGFLIGVAIWIVLGAIVLLSW